MSEEKPLLILKASAGSGKTYRLVEEFLKIILKEKSDTYYQSVLALTFTNKAAKEMKERIIEALEVLSKDPGEEGFDNEFLAGKVDILGMSPEKIREKSKSCLNEIIHNYGNLSIMTIDKFSHKIVRAFARDLELESDFGIELDTNELKREVIADIVDSYGKDTDLSNTLYKYSQSNIEEGSLWNVSQNLLKFSKTIDNEKFEPELEKLRDLNEDDFDRIQKELDTEMAKLQGSYENLVKEFFNYLASLSSDYDDYAQVKNGIFGNIERKQGKKVSEVEIILSKSTLQKLYDKQDFGRKQGASGAIVTSNSSKISEYIDMHDTFLEKQLAHYKVIKGIRSKIYNIRLIKRIQSTVDQIKQSKNIKEIGDLNKEIAQIILSESVPFIYERIGERYKHFLLDEFQDTSIMQWQNLIPLVENGLSEDHKSLIVGDAKQSIYRFRNGEVEQFVKLPDLYNPRKSDIIEKKRGYFKERGVEDPLKDNWRSREEVVQFNNMFFSKFAEHIPEEYKEVYTQNLEQTPRKGKGGYVSVHLKEEYAEDEKVESVLETIQLCFEDGFKPKDICIILRKKKKGVALAEALENEKIPVISDESLFVSSDIEVQFMIALLSMIEDPLAYEKQTLFAERFLQAKGQDTNSIIDYQYQEDRIRYFKLDQFLSDKDLPSLKSMIRFDSLVELAYWIKSEFNLQYEENPYLELFFEQVYQYEIQNAAYLKGFIDWWQEKGKEHAISIPESTNAIKLMTIHKSKGLQFPVVIIPNADWGFGDIGKNEKRDTLWVNQDNGILNTFCIDTSNPDNESDPELKAILQKEKNQMILDETNNLYVAFTRPIERLYVFGELKYVKKQDDFDKEKISSSIYKTLDEQNHYEYGEPQRYAKKKSSVEKEVSLNSEVSGKQGVAFSFKPVYPNESIQYNIDFGLRLHKLLSRIEAITDFDRIDEFLLEQELSTEESVKLKDTAVKFIQQDDIKKILFENNTDVYSEYNLIDEAGKLLRPDRVLVKSDKLVVVDFKTGKPRKKDQKQLDVYINTLKQMGNENVEGCLLYVNQQ